MISKTTIKSGVIVGVIQEVVLPGYEPLCGTISPRRGVADAVNLRGSRPPPALETLKETLAKYVERHLLHARSGNVQVPEWTVRSFVSPKCRKFHAMAGLETKQRMGDKLEVHAAVAARPAATDTPALTYHIAEVGATWLKNIAGSPGKELIDLAADLIPLPKIHAVAKKVKGMAGELSALAGVDDALLDSVLAAIKTNLVFVEGTTEEQEQKGIRGIVSDNVSNQNAICRDILRHMAAMFRQSCQFGKIRRFLLEKDLERIAEDQRANISNSIQAAFSEATKDTDATHDEAAELSSLRIENDTDFDTFRGALEAAFTTCSDAVERATRESSKWEHYMNHGLGVVAGMGFNTGDPVLGTRRVQGQDGRMVEESERCWPGDGEERFGDELTWLQIATTLLDSCHKYEARRHNGVISKACGQKVIIYTELLDAFIVSTLMALLPDAVRIVTSGTSRHTAAQTVDLVGQLKIDLQTKLEPTTGQVSDFSRTPESGVPIYMNFLSIPNWRPMIRTMPQIGGPAPFQSGRARIQLVTRKVLVPLEQSYRDENQAEIQILKARLKSLTEENSRLTKENASLQRASRSTKENVSLQLASRLTKENVGALSSCSSNGPLSTRPTSVGSTRSTSVGSSRGSSGASTPSNDPQRPQQPARRKSAWADDLAELNQREMDKLAQETMQLETRMAMARQSALDKLAREEGVEEISAEAELEGQKPSEA